MIDTKYFNLLYDDKIITGEESPINFVGENGFIVINFVQSDFIHVHLRLKVKNFDSIGYHDILSMIPYNILLYDKEHGGNRLDMYYYNWYCILYGPTILLNIWYSLDYIINGKEFTVYLNGSKIGSFINNSGVNAGSQIAIQNGRYNSSAQTLVDYIYIYYSNNIRRLYR